MEDIEKVFLGMLLVIIFVIGLVVVEWNHYDTQCKAQGGVTVNFGGGENCFKSGNYIQIN